jgi:hypothetical protein
LKFDNRITKKHNIVQKDRPLERKLNHVKLMKGNITLCACVRVLAGGGDHSLLFLVRLLQNQENVQF